MDKFIHNYFARDHHRLDTLFNKAIANPLKVDKESYHQFRQGLLTHIKMEEKILFKMAQAENKGELLPLQAQLRLEHGAITTLMVCEPTKDVIKVTRFLLNIHNDSEEREGGMYDQCEMMTEKKKEVLIQSLNATTPVPIHPINQSPKALVAAKNAVKRAGYDFDTIVTSNNPL